MSLTVQHLNVISSELRALTERHHMQISSAAPKLLQEKYEFNRPFNVDLVKEYKSFVETEFPSYLIRLKDLLFNLLDKMEISSLSEEDKNKLNAILQSQFNAQIYCRGFDSIPTIVKSKCRQYGISTESAGAKSLARITQINRALVESGVHNRNRKFLANMNNELTIYTLNTPSSEPIKPPKLIQNMQWLLYESHKNPVFAVIYILIILGGVFGLKEIFFEKNLTSTSLTDIADIEKEEAQEQERVEVREK